MFLEMLKLREIPKRKQNGVVLRCTFWGLTIWWISRIFSVNHRVNHIESNKALTHSKQPTNTNLNRWCHHHCGSHRLQIPYYDASNYTI